MFPIIQIIKTRVANIKSNPTVEFYNSDSEGWEKDITLTYTSSGMAIFTLDTDLYEEPYVFFGALQQVQDGGNPDTNWDFVINGEGNIMTFTNACENNQNIDVRLTLVTRNAEDLDNAIISADPRFKNVPD